MNFRANLETVASDLIKLYGLEFKKEVKNLSSPLDRWLDFRLRYIDPAPRNIVYSCALPKSLPKEVRRGFNILKRLIRQGADINNYQSKTLIRFHDASGSDKAKRTDLLWADWGITHLHITDITLDKGDSFSHRKCSNGECWLLFCLFFGKEACFIDIRKHNDEFLFSDIELMRIIKKSWPNYMSRFKLKGILAGRKTWTNQEIAMLRKAGIFSPIVLDDEVFMGPGRGITSASTPAIVVRAADDVIDWVESLEVFANDPQGQLQTEVKKLGIQEPKFEFSLTPKGISLFEPTTKVAFTFSKKKDDYHTNMENLFLPDWALKKIVSQYPQLSKSLPNPLDVEPL